MPTDLPPRPKTGKKKKQQPGPVKTQPTIPEHSEVAHGTNVLPSGKERDPFWKKRGRPGRRDLMRVIEHKAKMAPNEFRTMASDPNSDKTPMHKRPSDEFIWEADRMMLSRYCNYLLQSILFLVRVFEPSKQMITKYGKGLGSSARYALYLCHSATMDNPAAKRMMNLTRLLYGRMLTDLENRGEVDEEVKKQWDQYRLTSVGFRIQDLIEETIIPKVLDGSFPRTNFQYPVDNQWDDVWQERCTTG